MKNVLITGASGGIGLELTRLFAKDKYNLVLIARNQEKLASLKKELEQNKQISVKVILKDLSESNSATQIWEELKKEKIEIDILVNNAGFGSYGFFAETELAYELQMLQVNIVTLTHLTKLFLKDFQERTQSNANKSLQGKILNVASIAAFQPGPLMAVYYASKAYVLSFSEALANELQDKNITVTTLCPGPTETDFYKKGQIDESILFKRKIMTAKQVAQIGYDGLMKNKTIVIPGLKNKVLVFLTRFTPRKILAQIVRNIQAPKNNFK